RIGLRRAARDHPARPVIFERAPHEMDAIGDERRGERIALMTLEALAVEGEMKRRGPVDQPALLQSEGGHQRVSATRAGAVEKISCVCVSRSTTSHERQPPA